MDDPAALEHDVGNPRPPSSGSWSTAVARQMTRSAALPGSIDPISSSTPTARAALIVTAASASVGVIRTRMHATVITSGSHGVGEVRG